MVDVVKETKKGKDVKDIKTSISSNGYAIYKNKFSNDIINVIKSDLTIKPFVCPGYGDVEDITPYKLLKKILIKYMCRIIMVLIIMVSQMLIKYLSL